MRITDKYDVNVNDVINYIRRPKTEYDRKKDNKAMIISAALCGFVVGGVIAILYTPESGNELRQDVSNLLRETNEKLVHLASDALNRIS